MKILLLLEKKVSHVLDLIPSMFDKKLATNFYRKNFQLRILNRHANNL